MNPEEQRIAIAEACGWKSILQTTGYLNDAKFPDTIPDYLNDLNVIHAAAVALPGPELAKFSQELRRASGYGIMSVHYQNDVLLIKAGADRWCKAFLKTIGKWKDQ